MRHENLTEHLCGDFPNFFRRFANVNSAFESVLERSFAATTGVDLRFNYNIDSSKLTRDLFRFIDGRRHFAMRRRHIELLQQFLSLILVNVHLLLPGGRPCN